MNKDMRNNEDLGNYNEEIDLKKILNFGIRRKFLLTGVTFLGTLAGVIYSLLAQPIFQGNFLIIIEDVEKNNIGGNANNSMANPLLSIISGGNSGYNYNETQEEILKSPLVLNPVYEFFKKNYSSSQPELKNISYQKWVENYLEINFEDGTSILKINLKNKDENAIITTLNLISSRYQEYSKRDRQRNIKNGIKYLQEQEISLRERSLKSLKNLNKFSIENGLGDIDGFVDLDKEFSNLDNLPFGLNDNDREISTLLKNKLNPDQIGNSGAGQRYQEQFALLSRYESTYSDLSAKLKPGSQTLKMLEKQIESLKDSLKRPNEILIEFRNLKRIASRDVDILTNFENNLTLLKLEEARNQTPWELISQPTIDDSRVFPQRKNIAFTSLFLSGILSLIIAAYKEKREDIVYEFDGLDKKIPFKFIDKLLKNESKLNNLIIESSFLKNKSDTLPCFVFIDNSFFTDGEPNLDNYFQRKEQYEFITLNQLEKLKNHENILLIAKSGTITNKKLDLIIKYLKNFKFSNSGWVLI